MRRRRLTPAPLVALGASVAVWALHRAGALPWPAVASQSLAGIFLLVAIARGGGELGLRAQRRLLPAVAGVALTAAAWFVGGGLLTAQADLLGLGLLHLGAAWLAAAPEGDERARASGRLVLGCTMATVSLLAIAALDRTTGRGGPALPVALATGLAAGALLAARDRAVGLVLAAAAGTVTIVLAARVLADATGATGATLAGPSAPLLAATAVVGAAAPVVACARRLPELLEALAPGASPRVRLAVAWAAIPAVAGVAVAFLAPGG